MNANQALWEQGEVTPHRRVDAPERRPAQILRISSAYAPPPPAGFLTPMTWGVADTVVERFTAAGVPAASISCRPATFTFDTPGPPSAFLDDFRTYYGPTMNAFAAVGESGREAEPHRELDELFAAQNTSPNPAHTTIPATYLEVTVRV